MNTDPKKPYFTCMPSPIYGMPSRWIAHDWNEHCAGEFNAQQEAEASVKLWNTNGGELVVMDWIAPSEDAPDSDRGTYIITLSGTTFEKRIWAGWSSMDIATREIFRLRNLISKYGYEVVLVMLCPEVEP